MSKKYLPVFWREHKKAWITKVIFDDEFRSCFCPEVKRYCKELSVSLGFKPRYENVGRINHAKYGITAWLSCEVANIIELFR